MGGVLVHSMSVLTRRERRAPLCLSTHRGRPCEDREKVRLPARKAALTRKLRQTLIWDFQPSEL